MAFNPFNLEFVTNGEVEFEKLELTSLTLEEAKKEAQVIADKTPNFMLGQVQQPDGLVLSHVVPTTAVK